MHSTSFVDIPKNPAKNNQKAAPGPPIPIATATPPMLPMPTVPEIAVDTAWKCDISPSASGSLYHPRDSDCMAKSSDIYNPK